MSGVLAVMKRELRSYFATPVAYVFIVIFLVLASTFTFYLGNFYERGQADLGAHQEPPRTSSHLTWGDPRRRNMAPVLSYSPANRAASGGQTNPST